MSKKFEIDLDQVKDGIKQVAQDAAELVQDGLEAGKKEFDKILKNEESRDYRPADPHAPFIPDVSIYTGFPWASYPKTDIYQTSDSVLIFEFAVPGKTLDQIDLRFREDYMWLSIEGQEEAEQRKNAKFFKNTIRRKPVKDLKYYVPEDKFEREKVKAALSAGILKVEIPMIVSMVDTTGVKIEINEGGAE